MVYANIAQLGPRQRIEHSRVESRMLLWCRAGRGMVIANGQRCPMEPGRYLILPWGHQIAYRASEDDPFLLAGIHIIPRHSRDKAVTYGVAHRPEDPLRGVAWRGDVALPSLRTLKQGMLDPASPLTHLAQYVLGLFVRGTPPEWLARQLAPPLLEELVLAAQQRSVYSPEAPLALERIVQYAQTRLAFPLSLSDLVTFSGLSPSTVGRMFRKHLRTTPVVWIQRQKMQLAGNLLRTRRLTIAEVGEHVGIPDPYYFSKCFHKHTGSSPRDYRRARHWL